ncbi:MAG: hypothetical protein RL719_696 [Actinomycetota bacterium]
MTVFFDARFIRPGQHDGISRFAANLFAELSKLRDVTAIISDEGQLKHLPTNTKHVLECAPTSASELGLAKRLNRMGAELVYSPMQTTGSLGKKFKLILTLHDLIYYRHRRPPREFSLVVRALWRLYHLTYIPARLILGKADALVTISDTSKRLIEQAKLFGGNIQVVYNASEVPALEAHRTKPKSKSLIYMGSFMEYKNVETLVAGMQHLPGFELHLLSKITPEQRARLQLLADQNRAQVVFHNGVSDDEYLTMLNDAFALVSASRDEGFGIPLIEAMSVSTPVVCSNIEIFREVGANAARYFETEDPSGFAQAVKSLEANWAQASELSLRNAQRFSWKISAQKLNDLIEQVLS